MSLSLNNHHAILLVGEKELAKSELWAWFMVQGVATSGNPDFFVFEEEVFGIEEARVVREKSLSRAFGKEKIFVLLPQRMTMEAQNALLKTLEDPMPDTRYFVVMREEGALLPTLQSRMQVIRLSGQEFRESSVSGFLKMSPVGRIMFAKEFADEDRDLVRFLDDLLQELKESGASPSIIKRVFNMRRHASDRAVSPRLILEHLAMMV